MKKVHCTNDCGYGDMFYQTPMVREQVTCKVCKKTEAYKKLPSLHRVRKQK